MSRPGPVAWSPGDVRTLFLLSTVGAGVLLASWTGTSGTGLAVQQTAWLALGIGGLLVLGLAGATWLLALRTAVAARRAHLLRTAVALLPAGLPDTVPAGRPLALPAHVVPSHHAVAVVAAGTTRYHRPDCLLVTSKEVVPLPASAHEDAGRTACEVCAP